MSDTYLASTWPREGQGLEYAIIKINEGLARSIASRLTAFQKLQEGDDDLIEMCFHESYANVSFYDINLIEVEGHLPLSMEELEHFEKHHWVKLPKEYPLPDEEKASTVDGLMLKISEWGFCWSALPDGDYEGEVYTENFGRDILSQII